MEQQNIEIKSDLPKKKAFVHVTGINYRFNDNEWDSFRSEGRIPLNIGFGLSLLGYDVNISCSMWNLNETKITWNNIKISKFPIYKYYDLVLTFSTFEMLYGLEFNTCLGIVYDDNHINKTKEFGRNIKYICNNLISIKYVKSKVENLESVNKVFHVPPLFPIPSVNIGFVECKYDPKLKFPKLKLLMYYTGWAQNTTISGDRFVNKETLIINHLKNKGYNIELLIIKESKDTICPIKNVNEDQSDIKFYHSCECSYMDIINLIQSVDMCITYGAPVFTGSSVVDMISLGKSVIYIGDGRLGNEWPFTNLNPLYEYPNNIIYIQEKDNESILKLDNIMNNPINIWKCYANTLKDYDFNNWKYFMLNVING